MTLIDAVLRVEELLIEQQKKIEMEQKNLEAKRQEKLRMEEHQKAKEKEAGQGQGGEDPNDPLYIPPFGTPSPGKKQTGGDDGSSPKALSPMRTPPKEGSLDANLAARSANTPSTKNPLVIDTGGSDIDSGIDHVVDDYDEGEDDEEEPPTPVVKLGRSEALPRRGSFRHSFSKGNDMGIDVDKLLAEEGVKSILADGQT